ncbi:NAD(P)-dependent oxidoreductase [uncultured Shimia sp.]|uniref:NAD-dependent epimerase/dehydratase family protein n=1 Tax=uncultured Shimia sp. TaxID=573152 RepID=UPI0025CF9880|nr:NAD-dependent epimerase/dehydratase family protein [uncultured Shimia sp.]
MTNLAAVPSSPSKTLLVLGSTGKLGRLLQACLTAAPDVLSGRKVVWGGRTADAGVDWVYSAGPPPKADAVLALWGVVPGKGDLANNIMLAHRAVAIAGASGAARVLHCSSSAVYGPAREATEASALAPVNAYGVAKIEMEQSLLSDISGQSTEPDSAVLRLANVVGADSLFRAIQSGQPVTLDAFDIGQSPIRSYATPTVIWKTVASLLSTNTMPDIVNVAASNPVAMHELLEAAQCPFVWRPAPETAVAEVSMSMARLRRLTGQTLVIPPQEMIAEWRRLTEAQA